MSKVSSFMASYDSGADVLYLSRMSERAARSREDKYGVVWRYDREGKLIGATVLDFYEVWSADTSVLVERLSKRFEIPTPQAQVVLDHALSLHRSEN